MQYPGNNAIEFVYPGIVSDRLHHIDSKASFSFTDNHCYAQPVSVRDKIDNTAYSQATDKVVCPVNENTKKIDAEWFANFNGLNYRVLGVKPFYDAWGRLVTISLYCKAETPSGGVVQ